MSSSHAQKFIDALHALEDGGDAAALVALFSDDATCDNLTGTDAQRGPDGARTFWETDRKLFDSIASDFRTVVEDGDVVTLEWVRSGQARDGRSVRYGGVSVIEYAGEKIKRFQAYYDPAALGAQAA